MATRAGNVLAFEPLSIEAVRTLLDPPAPPCLSLYLPTHRNVPDNTVDRPTFARLVDALELALAATRARGEIERLLHPFRLLATDRHFWEHTQDGLAVLAGGGRARVFVMQRTVRPLAMVAARFHTAPLIRAVSALDRFAVLALTSRTARVYAGRIWHDPQGCTAEKLDPVPVVAVPGGAEVVVLSRDEVISPEVLEPHRVKHGTGPAGRAGPAFVHGGFGSKHDDVDRDTEIFLRHVDTVVAEQVSRPSGLPLVLVCQGRLAASFRGLSANPLLIDEHVDLDPHLLPETELAAAVAPVFGRARATHVAREVRAYELARDRGLAAGDLADVARAAVAGQVATLLVDADRFEAGSFDRVTGAIEFSAAGPAGTAPVGGVAATGEDLQGAIAETVLAKGGTVVALARIAMPTESGVAAIFRYA